MRKLFFLSVFPLETSKMTEKDVIAEAANKLNAAGARNYDLFYGEAVHWQNPNKVEQGAVVHIDDDDLAFRSALELKEWLRHGTYLVVLNESSYPNVTFRTAVLSRDVSISKTASAWKEYACRLWEEERLFVSAFMFKDTDGEVAIIGNANPDMVVDMDKWQKTAVDIVNLFNKHSDIALCESIFMEKVDDFNNGAEEIHEGMMTVNFKLMNCRNAAERQIVATQAIASLDKKVQVLKDKFPKHAKLWGLLNQEWLNMRHSLTLCL